MRLTYEPAATGKRATLLVRLALGVCTTDRVEGRDGCLVTLPPASLPLNLRLGDTDAARGVASVGTEGDVTLSFDARATLAFGVVLPTVLPSTVPTELPKSDEA